MAEFNIRSDAVDVEQIMRQIRARVREKRGADYTEQEIRQLANAKLETFLDPSRVRSDLLEQFRSRRRQETPPPNFAFEDSTIFETHRGPLRFVRRLLRPILKLFFNPNPISEALHIQAKVNQRTADALARIETLHYELIHNLVVEVTRLGIDVKNLKMRVESVSGRLDFDERRARALEGVVQYKTGSIPAPRPAPQERPASAEAGGEDNPATGERRRRRRRRGRRRHEGVPGMGTASTEGASGTAGDAGGHAGQPPDSGFGSESASSGAQGEIRLDTESAVPAKADSTES